MKVNRPSLNKRTRGQRILNSVGFSIHVYVVVQFFSWFKNILNQFNFFEPVQIS